MNKFNNVIHLIIVVLGDKCWLISSYDYKQQLFENKPQESETNKEAESRK